MARDSKLYKKKLKQQKRRRKKINSKIDRTVSLLAILVCIAFSVADVLEKGGKINLKRTTAESDRKA